MHDKQAFVRRRDFASAAMLLPEVRRWDGTGIRPDLFVCAIGFEDRARAVSQMLSTTCSGAQTCVALVGQYQTNSADNEASSSPIVTALQSFCKDVRFVGADHPHEVSRAIDSCMNEMPRLRPLRVAIDLSGASGTFILSALGSILRYADEIRLEVLYAEPEQYFPKVEEYESSLEALIESAIQQGDAQSFSEHGVSSVQVNELHPGVSVESRPDFIIALPSLRTSRLVKCLSHIGEQPLAAPAESIFWILSDPPASSMKWRLELQRRIVCRQLASIVGKEPSDPTAPRLTEANSKVCSTLDYRSTLEALIHQIDARAGSNLWLIHMGAKLQGVGVALALASRSEVAVVSSSPLQFNASRYSSGVGPLWHITFEEPGVLVGKLRQIGQLVLETTTKTSREPVPEL